MGSMTAFRYGMGEEESLERLCRWHRELAIRDIFGASVYAGVGRLNVVLVAAVAFAAAVTGDNIGFAIGHFGGRALALRWSRYVFLTEAQLDKAEAFFNRHGAWIITVARFIEGLRQANGIIAGTTGMRWLRFLAFNALGAALWV